MGIWLVTFHEVPGDTESFCLIALLSSVVLEDRRRERGLHLEWLSWARTESSQLHTVYMSLARTQAHGHTELPKRWGM